LAAVAAFTAAGLSLVNVAITAWLARRGHREQWRREQERPIVAHFLTLSVDARHAWWDASEAKQAMGESDDLTGTKAEENLDKGARLAYDLACQAAQLDLLASDSVRQAAHALVVAHQKEPGRLLMGFKPGQDDNDGRWACAVKIGQLEAALVERTRADLGLGPGYQPSGNLPASFLPG
jgi:hypothetical protein